MVISTFKRNVSCLCLIITVNSFKIYRSPFTISGSFLTRITLIDVSRLIIRLWFSYLFPALWLNSGRITWKLKSSNKKHVKLQEVIYPPGQI